MRRTLSKTSPIAWGFCSLLLAACGAESTDSVGAAEGSAIIPTRDVPAQNSVVDVVVDGETRQYRLYVPSNTPSSPMPLLVAFHGGSGSNYPFPQQSAFHSLAEQEGFVVAYPLAQLLVGHEGEWLLNTGVQPTRDIRFVDALIQDVQTFVTLDTKRIYATGYSLGSMFTYEVACHLSTRFAAMASYAGTMPVSPARCAPPEAMGIMHIHGFDDGTIAYGSPWEWKNWDSVGAMMDIPALVDFWRERFDCQSSATNESSSSSHNVHTDCTSGVRVEHHGLYNVGHEWPEQIDGTSTHEVIWSFVSEFRKP